MKTCIIIPVYNHEQALPSVVAAIKPFGLQVFLIDDGSSKVCHEALEEFARREADWLTLIVRAENGGKGAAVLDGFRAAIAQGFTHALQIDADGQHRIDDIPRFLDASRQHPEALIAGFPVFGKEAPLSRQYGRQFTNLWVWINTLSFAIGDAMCGFRLYPLVAVERLCAYVRISRRMDFDIDIIVRLYWRGVRVINLPTRVSYPLVGISHFRLWQDNLMISKIHARLFFGMLARLPRLILRHWQ
ncbi:glycosyltransferase family 2 protein [Methylomicrobium sp. Wu6]|uniref:glycosyltransferase family 2 protein n=1 Tax=Methylomicrobium sp. Wu6 TaxID=3107928 RepID=UPI002DD69E9E|nr:glycosyltransferase family 2 protein [Methylomicrobium sp. Wu6]MEC4747114.1 glycosyltransferase family 2 protein [Methylomicrobium sp. Wu6]